MSLHLSKSLSLKEDKESQETKKVEAVKLTKVALSLK